MYPMEDASTVYEYSTQGEVYCYRYPDPETRNGGRTFTGVAVAWKKSEPNQTFTVPYFVKADDIDQVQIKIREGIDRHFEA